MYIFSGWWGANASSVGDIAKMDKELTKADGAWRSESITGLAPFPEHPSG